MFQYTPPPSLHSTASQFGNVASGNYAEFDANGFLTFYGAARPYLDFNFDVAQLRSGASAPDLIPFNATSIDISGFDGNATLEQVDFGLELQHSWAEGTILCPNHHRLVHSKVISKDVLYKTWHTAYSHLQFDESLIG